MRRPFREMNPVPIGAVGLAVLVILLVAALNIESLPLIGGGNTYHAAFSEAAGLKAGDEVRIAGVKVGKVEKVDLDGAHVRVDFRVDDGVHFGPRTRAAIKIKTALGAKYLALQPEGDGQLAAGSQIPLSRTQAPYDVTAALGDLSDTVGQIDTQRLAKAFNTLSATFADSPPEVKASLRGLTRLSKTVSSRDEKLRELLHHAKGVTGVLAARNEEFTTLLADGDKLLEEVKARRQVIHQLLLNTVRLSDQLTALVQENQEQLQPTLDHLHNVVRVLVDNQRNLDRSIHLLEPFVREFTDTLGSGRWFDTYIQNLVPLPPSVRAPRK